VRAATSKERSMPLVHFLEVIFERQPPENFRRRPGLSTEAVVGGSVESLAVRVGFRRGEFADDGR
jgi:hypothetical protein